MLTIVSFFILRVFFSWMDGELGRVDVCINNAGLATASTLSEGKMDEWRKMLDVNVLGKEAGE